MTYILGFSYQGINSIIGDCRLTSTDKEGRNVSLKTGLLFPGCIFGRTGNDASSRDFILGIKKAITAGTTLSDLWRQFEEFIHSYDMPVSTSDTDGRFQLLLSSRCRGKPEFFVLDSYQRSLEPVHAPWISLGSGKVLLDALVERVYAKRIDGIMEEIRAHGVPSYVIFNFVCLWLSELTLTFEKGALESHGVGGAFHFLLQTEKYESTQAPALYVFIDADVVHRQVILWQYRICFVQGCLVVEHIIPPNQTSGTPKGQYEAFVMCDTTSGRDVEEKVTSDPDFGHTLKKQIDGLPFYRFCGFGFANPRLRLGFGFHFTNEGKYAVTRDGRISDEVWAHILNTIRRSL